MDAIVDVIGKGFGVWWSNLDLYVPFLLNIYISMRPCRINLYNKNIKLLS
jgi:hypothetical protein